MKYMYMHHYEMGTFEAGLVFLYILFLTEVNRNFSCKQDYFQHLYNNICTIFMYS